MTNSSNNAAKMEKFFVNAENENCDSWTRVINYSLIALMLDMLKEDGFKELQDQTKNNRIRDSKYNSFKDYIIKNIIKLKQEITATKDAPSKDLVSCKTFPPYSGTDLPTFDDIIGLREAKEEMRNSLVKPLIYPSLYGSISKGILLYGSPGTGKTELVKASISELQKGNNIHIKYFTPTGGELKGKFVGQSEKQIRSLFECASEEACREYPQGFKGISIIFLDEFEAIAGDRSSDSSGIMTTTVNALLQAMQGVKVYKNVVVIAATNYPEKLDPAIVRRFSRRIFVRMPDNLEIEQMLNYNISKLVYESLKAGKAGAQDEIGIYCRAEHPEIFINTGPVESTSAEDSGFKKDDWKTYKQYMSIDEKAIKAGALYLSNHGYSGSDITHIFSNMKQLMAVEAERKNIFVQKNIDSDNYWISVQSIFDFKDSNIRYMNNVITDIYGKVLPNEITQNGSETFTISGLSNEAPMITNMPNVYVYYNKSSTPCNSWIAIDMKLIQTEGEDRQPRSLPSVITSNDFPLLNKLKRETNIKGESLPVRIWARANITKTKIEDFNYTLKEKSGLISRGFQYVWGGIKRPFTGPEKTELSTFIANHSLYVQSLDDENVNLYQIEKDISRVIRNFINNEDVEVNINIYDAYSIYEVYPEKPTVSCTLKNTSISIGETAKVVNPINLYVNSRLLNTAISNIQPTVRKEAEQKLKQQAAQ